MIRNECNNRNNEAFDKNSFSFRNFSLESDVATVFGHAELVLSQARHVAIDSTRVEKVAEILAQDSLGGEAPELPTWNWPPHFPNSEDFEDMAKFYLLFNSINYCYFHMPVEFYADGTAMVKRFSSGDLIEEGLTNTRLTEHWSTLKDPEFLANISEDFVMDELFKAEVSMPLIKERITAMREVGEYWQMQANPMSELFSQAQGDALKVAKLLPSLMPSYSDQFLKRAQLFVAMVQGRFAKEACNPIQQESLRSLTAFADYLCPVTLTACGIAKLSPELEKVISSHTHIPEASQVEQELRALVVVAVRQVRDQLDRLRGDEEITDLHLDYPFWFYGRPETAGNAPDGFFTKGLLPHHKTITTDY